MAVTSIWAVHRSIKDALCNRKGMETSRSHAKTREECEEKLAELIKAMKAEIAEMKKTKQV